MRKGHSVRYSVVLSAFVLMLILPLPAGFGDNPPELSFGKDKQGEYAIYKLKQGDTVWASVVMRFVVENKRDNKTAAAILTRSGIADATKMRVGTTIKIPVELLKPDIVLKAAKSKPLGGVVVIIDPGHGGVDTGARAPGNVYEDEVNYDIAIRLKEKLEEETAAEVYMTVRDKSRGWAPNHGSAFPRDTDEYVMVNPIHPIQETTISLHLRWYLANYIYYTKQAAGISTSNMVFISIHADALGSKPRGSMVYYPGKDYVGSFTNPGPTLRKYAEVRYRPNATFVRSEMERSENVSRAFALTLINSLHKNRIKVHDNKPVRDHIVRRSSFLPAVLKYNKVPTKVLIETVNLENGTDRSRIKSARFRELYAKAILEALITFYK